MWTIIYSWQEDPKLIIYYHVSTWTMNIMVQNKARDESIEIFWEGEEN